MREVKVVLTWKVFLDVLGSPRTVNLSLPPSKMTHSSRLGVMVV